MPCGCAVLTYPYGAGLSPLRAALDLGFVGWTIETSSALHGGASSPCKL